MPEMLDKGGIWKIDSEIDDEAVECYCLENNLKYIPLHPFSTGGQSVFECMIDLLEHEIKKEHRCPDTETYLDALKTAELSHRHFTSRTLNIFEWLYRSNGTNIVIMIQSCDHFPMGDGDMEALHSILQANKGTIVMLFKKNRL